MDAEDLDEDAPSVTSAATATSIDENSGAGQVIYTATVDDSADVSGGVTFTLGTDGDAGLLSIDGGTGEVTLTGNPDDEAKADYSFTVIATDAANNATSQAVTLDINDLDEVAPSVTSAATATSIDENSGAGQVIYTATADDSADVSGGVTFTLGTDGDEGLLSIDKNGAVTLTGNPDDEAKADYSFTVIATGGAGSGT